MTTDPLLDVQDLTVRLETRRGTVNAVNGISFQLRAGETLGIVGESGSGKSVLVLTILRLIPSPPSRVESGRTLLEGRDILRVSDAVLRSIRGNDIGIVFQEPMTSLNPVMTVGRQLMEPLTAHLGLSRRAARDRAAELLDLVKIPNASRRLGDFPFQFSGGMRQRVMIAMALSCEPKILIADEPTTALDVTIQAEIIDLIKQLQQQYGMALIWVTHDLGVVAAIADTVQVMYAGRVLERGPVRSVFADARNAYTLGLLKSMPRPDAPKGSELTPIQGSPPNLMQVIQGDPFAPRNPYATPRCFEEMPPLEQVSGGAPGHLVAAWYDLKTAAEAGYTDA